tara:strand:+ start:416 stop:649 length:234 start_codon:yes stop_codon:yes gene_type:complete
MTCHSKLIKLGAILRHHDWHYQRSDDNRYYEAGLRESKYINELCLELINEGFYEEMVITWKSNAHEFYKNNHPNKND